MREQAALNRFLVPAVRSWKSGDASGAQINTRIFSFIERSFLPSMIEEGILICGTFRRTLRDPAAEINHMIKSRCEEGAKQTNSTFAGVSNIDQADKLGIL